uniref:Uncharacterized protein n=1 Tax=Leersia perrieri TaxID=77586 RepID=A0A0D9XN61_9ORYZ
MQYCNSMVHPAETTRSGGSGQMAGRQQRSHGGCLSAAPRPVRLPNRGPYRRPACRPALHACAVLAAGLLLTAPRRPP